MKKRPAINPVVAAWKQASEADKVVFREWFTELEHLCDDEAEPNELYELGRLLLALVDDISEDAALYVLIAGICETLAVELDDFGQLTWMAAISDERLIELCTMGGDPAPDLADGGLDRARSRMKAAGLLSYAPKGSEFIYLLKPPVRWLEMISEQGAAP